MRTQAPPRPFPPPPTGLVPTVPESAVAEPDLERPPAWTAPAVLIGLAGLAAAAVATVLVGQSELALGIPAVILGAAVCARWPALAVVAIFVLVGAEGSLAAFVGHRPRVVLELVLLALWVGVVVGFFTGRRRPLWLWPGLLAPALYGLLSAVEILLADPVSLGFLSFRASVWPMMGAILVAIAPWPQQRFMRIARGVLVVACLVGAYAVFRWVAGPSTSELQVARASLKNIPLSADLRFFASFPTAQQLASFCATMIPFALALLLAWRGRWRITAAAVIAGLGFALVASKVAAGAFAVMVGLGVTLLLYLASAAFPSGRRLATALLASVAVLAIGAGGFLVAIEAERDNPESEVFLTKILTPSEDPSYQIRLERWDIVLDEASEAPFGHGLGTAGGAAFQREGRQFEVNPQFDNSYLKVAFEQGIVAMVLFAIALLLLLCGLGLRAVRTLDRDGAALGIAACGSLASLMVLFYVGFYSEHVQVYGPWLLVGLGAAQFTTARARARPAAQGAATDQRWGSRAIPR